VCIAGNGEDARGVGDRADRGGLAIAPVDGGGVVVEGMSAPSGSVKVATITLPVVVPRTAEIGPTLATDTAWPVTRTMNEVAPCRHRPRPPSR